MFGRRRRRKKKITKTVEIPAAFDNLITVDFQGVRIEYQIGNAQHIGSRKRQEDSFGFSDLSDDILLKERGICAVLADGMGGLDLGREVSEQVVRETLEFFRNMNYQVSISEQMILFFQKFSQQIFSRYGRSGKAGAGSTVLMVVLYGGRVYWCAIGDSRLYLWRRNRLYQMNEDHNYKNELMGQYISGEGTLEEAARNPKKDFLTNYIGCPETVRADVSYTGFALQNGDKILMATDGLYYALSQDEIAEKMRKNPQDACTEMIQEAVSRKISGQDNMTAMAVGFN